MVAILGEEKCRTKIQGIRMRAYPQDAVTQSSPENGNFSINVPPASLILLPKNAKYRRLKFAFYFIYEARSNNTNGVSHVDCHFTVETFIRGMQFDKNLIQLLFVEPAATIEALNVLKRVRCGTGHTGPVSANVLKWMNGQLTLPC